MRREGIFLAEFVVLRVLTVSREISMKPASINHEPIANARIASNSLDGEKT